MITYILLIMIHLHDTTLLPSVVYSLMMLDSPLTEMEISTALKSFKPFKSPGPDGLHSVFCQKFWLQLKTSIINFCNNIFPTKQISELINETFLCLIPKVQILSSMAQYRPISLCNMTYKLITKLSQIILNLICQTSSIHPNLLASNRRASNNAIILQEVLNHFRV